jgi:hypothetical protein
MTTTHDEIVKRETEAQYAEPSVPTFPGIAGSFNNLTVIGDWFMNKHSYTSITNGPSADPLAFDTSVFPNVKHIGCGFFYKSPWEKSPKLTTVDLSGWQVESVGAAFLSNNDLTSIDLSFMKGVKEIKEEFLDGNRITSIDLSPLSEVVTTGAMFLAGNEIESVDLSPLKNLTTVGLGFLASNKLTSIDLKDLGKVEVIFHNFLGGNQIETIDLEPLVSLKGVYDMFLAGNNAAETYDVSQVSDEVVWGIDDLE